MDEKLILSVVGLLLLFLLTQRWFWAIAFDG